MSLNISQVAIAFRVSMAVRILAVTGLVAAAEPLDGPIRSDRYTPTAGGWQILLECDEAYRETAERLRAAEPALIQADTQRLTPNAPIGTLVDNPRNHLVTLFPPGDKSLIWTDAELAKSPRVNFRPLILAYNSPRFLMEYHSAGGLLGHLQIGLVPEKGPGRWFHDWSRIEVRYIHGRLEYKLTDPDYPDTTVSLTASPLADSAGLIVKVHIANPPSGATLVWTYGGASAFFTNWQTWAPELQFAPHQCAKDHYEIDDACFKLTRGFDDSDAITSGDGKLICMMRILPEWQARLCLGSSFQGHNGLGSPEQFRGDPALLLQATRWVEKSGDHVGQNCVAVQKVALEQDVTEGYILVGMGGNIRQALQSPAITWQESLARNESIAGRMVTRTPDPYLDAAASLMAFANDGTWGGQAYVHGGWSWRFAYLGWRILFGPTCYGWTDQVAKSIRNHCQLGLITEGPDQGGLSHYLESPGFFYNMNEVFLDMVAHYYEYTDDLALMQEIYPVLEGMLERQNRRLRPTAEPLYENALNTWISDSHWYIRGQCTQSSAYMLRAYEFMAGLAERLDRDPGPFREHALAIREAINRVLWQKRLGVFAEYQDTRGHRLLHGEPEVPTIYHSAEFGAADHLQILQMLHWADTHIRQEQTPGEGMLYWSANWYPNLGRSYTHSTHDLAYAEQFNFAETNYLAGRSDTGYRLLRAALSGMFNGPMPGQLGCPVFVDGMQRGHYAFADASSMFARAVYQGLFGIRVDRPRRVVHLTPQPPESWPEAAIDAPHFSYQFKRAPGSVRIDWRSPVVTAVKLSLSIKAARIQGVMIDGQSAKYELRPGSGLTWVDTLAGEALSGTIQISYTPDTPVIPPVMATRQGQLFELDLPAGKASRWSDPQGLLSDARLEGDRLIGKVVGDSGPGLLFVLEDAADCPRWIPVALDIASETPKPVRRWQAPEPIDRDLARWHMIDLSGFYNAEVSEVPKRLAAGAIAPEMPADQVGFHYWLEHVTYRTPPPSDQAWRDRIDSEGMAWTADGVPFRSPGQGPNISAVAILNRDFPETVSFPVGAAGRTLYLMIGGMTHPIQSHVTNLRVSLRYRNGDAESHDLVNPFDIGDCWSTYFGPYFDTPANGFENIGGRKGPRGRCEVADITQPVAVDTIAHLLAFPLKSGEELQEVEIRAIANDVVFGVMGASVMVR
ncbi:MAG: DUF4450 domain-containing protein [Phycisphaerales bacterium]|nr:DUF4450 domain-containing protein [Phycisphaerales bacterium]